MKSSGNTIVITGATSGIGRELAVRFHALGNTVIAAGRRQALLDALTAAHPGMAGHALDVADRAGIEAFAARVAADHPALDVLINNAGIMLEEDMTAAGVDAAEEIVAINLLGPIRLTAALLPHLMARPAATIVNVTSGLAFVPMATTPTYSATKAALHSYTQSLRHQLRGTQVEVVELAPPKVQTELTPGQSADPTGMPLAAFMTETMELLLRQPTPPEVCTQRVMLLRRAEAEGRFEQVYGMINQP